MTSWHNRKAYTLVEIMIVVTIISILAVISYRSSTGVMRKSTLVGQAVGIKGSILKARARAIEKTVQVKVDLTDGNFLALADLDRGGFFGQNGMGLDDINELVVGNSVTEGIDFEAKKVDVIPVNDSDLGSGSIPHPSGAYSIDPAMASGYSTFPNDEFLVLPSGIIVSPANTSTPISGTIFMKTSDGEMLALIHVSALGEVKVAVKQKFETEWVWQ